jgi:hypothetical protein
MNIRINTNSLKTSVKRSRKDPKPQRNKKCLSNNSKNVNSLRFGVLAGSI